MNYQVNKLVWDDFGRPHGILAVNKPVGMSSHDVVAKVRKSLQTKKVGHAGALDPFASGVLMIIVGKATKLSDEIMAQGKTYTADMIFGIATDTQDTEGEIINAITETGLLHEKITEQTIDLKLSEIRNGYDQFVPVFSSAKVNGQKLRILARKYPTFETYFSEGEKYVKFHKTETNAEIIVKLPKHHVVFDELKIAALLDLKLTDLDQTNQYNQEFVQKAQHYNPKLMDATYKLLTIETSCPKGTYIRQLAEDLGSLYDPVIPAMVVRLVRTAVGKATLENSLEINDIAGLRPTI